MNCEKCNKEHDGSYGSGRFCQQACSRSFSTKAKRKEISEKARQWSSENNPATLFDKSCLCCSKEFQVKKTKKNAKFCSRSCASRWRNDERNPDYALNKARAIERGKKSAAAQRAKRRSKNEIHFASLCQEHFDKVLTNEPMFNGWDADVIIPELKIAVLWNGKWHYEKIMEGTSLKQIQNRDKIKMKEIRAAGYKPYVIKDMGKESPALVQAEWLKFLQQTS
tara:strand:+ start:170 stop:838 length:669 start_codon:yes stop_codon:yes gene_type:complete